MTTISTDDVKRLADLSGFTLAEDEIERMKQDLAEILSYVGQLNELDTTKVEPTYQVSDLSNVWREDTIAIDGVPSETLLSLAPESLAHQIKVPKVL